MAQDKGGNPTMTAGLLDEDADLGRGLAKRDRKPSPFDDLVGQVVQLWRDGTPRVGRIVSKDAEAQVKDLNDLRRAASFHGVQLKTRKQGANPLEVRFEVKGNR